MNCLVSKRPWAEMALQRRTRTTFNKLFATLRQQSPFQTSQKHNCPPQKKPQMPTL